MSSMFTKAIIMTCIIFIPMVIINALLVANSPKFELLNWVVLITAGTPLIIILISAVAIKMNVRKK